MPDVLICNLLDVSWKKCVAWEPQWYSKWTLNEDQARRGSTTTIKTWGRLRCYYQYGVWIFHVEAHFDPTIEVFLAGIGVAFWRRLHSYAVISTRCYQCEVRKSNFVIITKPWGDFLLFCSSRGRIFEDVVKWCGHYNLTKVIFRSVSVDFWATLWIIVN